MASIQQDPSGNFHVCFRFRDHRFKRSLKTNIRRKAEAVNGGGKVWRLAGLEWR